MPKKRGKGCNVERIENGDERKDRRRTRGGR